MTTELQQNRYDQIMRRVGDMKGPGSKVSEVIPELFPMIDVERVPGELLALDRRVLGMGSFSVLAGAGQFPKIALFNPVGSGLLVTITNIVLASTNNTGMVMALTSTPLGTAITTVIPRDTRHGITTLPTATMSQEISPGAINFDFIANVLANQSIFLHDENGVFVLAPGSGVIASTDAAAIRATASFRWRERAALPSELNF